MDPWLKLLFKSFQVHYIHKRFSVSISFTIWINRQILEKIVTIFRNFEKTDSKTPLTLIKLALIVTVSTYQNV